MANILLVTLFFITQIINYSECSEFNEENTFYSDKMQYSQRSSIRTDRNSIHDSDIYATTVDFIAKYGYPVESHTVTTEDGYLLTVHRIPGSPKTAYSGSRGPVLVQHGLFSASENWVLAGPEQGLGFLLADLGYDVWLGNFRGNFYSRKHVNLSPEDPKFWDFSWHEMGVYDLTAVIDHILKVTNQPQLFYIGYSMGTTTFFVMTSRRPEYNRKIKLMVALAPVVYIAKTKAKVIRGLSNFYKPLDSLLKFTRFNELFPRQRYVQGLLATVCREGNPLLELCLQSLDIVFGFNRDALNKTVTPLIFSHFLAGGSEKTLIHYAQNIYTDRFQEFSSTGEMGTKPREYDLLQVTAPVYMVYAYSDLLATPEATMKLSRVLRNVVKVSRLPDSRAGHLDFTISNKVKALVYDEVLNALNSFR